MIISVYIMFPSIEILRILKAKDGSGMIIITIIRDAHIHCCRRGHTIDKCHYLHGFLPNYKRRNFFVNNVTIIKKTNESKTLTNQKESQQSTSFSLN